MASVFHGIDAVAPLKLRADDDLVRLASGFPRHQCRGHIEATNTMSSSRSWSRFPRRLCRGLIEARSSSPTSSSTSGSSTALPPWPHSSVAPQDTTRRNVASCGWKSCRRHRARCSSTRTFSSLPGRASVGSSGRGAARWLSAPCMVRCRASRAATHSPSSRAVLRQRRATPSRSFGLNAHPQPGQHFIDRR